MPATRAQMGESMKAWIKGFLCLSVLGLSACVAQEVKPWQRGDLARPEMAFNTGLMERAQRQHTFVSKEAASGDGALAGGGCGCN